MSTMSNVRNQRRELYERLIGHKVSGKYAVTGLLGFGGMGAVYEAIQSPMDRKVALKLIPTHDPTSAARFEREAYTVSKLSHPNTVTVFDFGQTEDGFLYLAMEHLDGQTLTDLIRSQAPLPPARVVHVITQACKSLGEAHRAGIIHRDVKPDNIFLISVDNDPDYVKVLDFGIAKAVQGEEEDVSLTADGRIIGTPRYMSPEQILAQPVDHRADIYALGCIVFEMLCGAPPFEQNSTAALMMSHAQQAPPVFAERLNQQQMQRIPPGLEGVVQRAMAKNPNARPQTMEEFARELDQALRINAAYNAGTGQHTNPHQQAYNPSGHFTGQQQPYMPSGQFTGQQQPYMPSGQYTGPQQPYHPSGQFTGQQQFGAPTYTGQHTGQHTGQQPTPPSFEHNTGNFAPHTGEFQPSQHMPGSGAYPAMQQPGGQPPPEPPKKDRRPLIAALVVIPLLIGGVAAYMMQDKGGKGETTEPTPTPKTVIATTTPEPKEVPKEAPQPKLVQFTIDTAKGSETRADVYDSKGMRVGQTPFKPELAEDSAPVTYRLSRDDHEDASVTLDPTKDRREFVVALVAKAKPKDAPPRPRTVVRYVTRPTKKTTPKETPKTTPEVKPDPPKKPVKPNVIKLGDDGPSVKKLN